MKCAQPSCTRAHEVRIETVPDAAIVEPTDALIRVTRACICGSDLWPYNGGPNVPTSAWATRRSASSRRSAATSGRSSAARS